MNFAYVSFVDDKIKRIVNLQDIKHSAKIVEGKVDMGKTYKVKYEDGEYYKAHIICLGKTYKEVENLIDKRRPRFPLNRLIEMNENGTSTTDSEVDVVQHQKASHKRLDDLNKGNYNLLTTQILQNKEINPNLNKTELLETEKHQTVNENVQLRKEIKSLTNQLQERDNKIEKLETLNQKLQEEILDKWNDVTQHISAPKLNDSQNFAIEARKDGKVHLGRDIWLSEHLYDTVDLRGKNPTKFVRELALHLFGTKVLRVSSVTGTVSNRTKGDAKSPLDPQKVMAIKDIVEWRLRKQGEQEKVIKKMCMNVTSILAQKIVDLNRPSRPRLVKESKSEKHLEEEKENNTTEDEENYYVHKEQLGLGDYDEQINFVVDDASGHLISETEMEKAEIQLMDTN